MLRGQSCGPGLLEAAAGRDLEQVVVGLGRPSKHWEQGLETSMEQGGYGGSLGTIGGVWKTSSFITV